MHGYQDSFTRAIRLSDTGLRDLAAVFARFAERLKTKTAVVFEIHHVAGTYAIVHTVEDVLAEKNFLDKKIRVLLIRLTARESGHDEWNDVAMLRIAAEPFYAAHHGNLTKCHAEIDMHANEEEWVKLFRGELCKQLERFSVDKSPLVRYRLLDVAGAALVALVGVIAVRSTVHYQYSPFDATLPVVYGLEELRRAMAISNANANAGMLSMLGLTVTAIASVMILVWAPITRLVTHGTEATQFLWGDEVERARDATALRANLVWIVLVGLIVGIAATLVGGTIGGMLHLG